MWKNMKRNLEWLLIVALLVGAVVAVGCEGAPPYTGSGSVDAGPDRTVLLGSETTTLTATITGINDSEIKSRTWTTVSEPDNASNTKWNEDGGMTLKFSPWKPGVYEYKFIVTLNTGAQIEDSIKLNYVYELPVANAGPDQTVTPYRDVYLNGTGQSDGQSVLWEGPYLSGYFNTYTGPSVIVGLLPHGELRSYTYTFSILDSTGNKISSDTVTITVSETASVNTTPVANAGPDQNTTVNTLVSLNGNISSDADGNPLTYAWTLTPPSGSNTALTGAMPTFTPDQVGNYVVSLIVNDGTVNSAADTVTISVAAAVPSNIAPVANAGPDQNATVGSVVTLSGGMSSDANGNALTYSWSFSSVPSIGSVGGTVSSATLVGANTISPTFTPDMAGDYVASLIVNDGMVNSAADTVIISAAAPLGGGTPAYVTDLKNLLTDNSFLVTHITASSGLLEVLEFGPYGPGGSMTFTYINPYFSSQSPHVRRTGSWMVLDGGGFAQASESLLFASRVLNTGSPVDATSSLTMTGYSSYSGITDSSVESWVKVAPLTVNDLAGRTFTSYPYSYSFTSDGSGSYGNAYSAPLPFTWLIDSVGRKAVLTFANGSTHQLFMTVRGLSGSVDREFGILALDSNGAVNSSSLMNWSW